MCELLAPNYDVDIEVKADWLELSAFFSKDGRIHLDNFVGSQDIAQDYEREDISDQDEFMEDLANSVLTEIQRSGYHHRQLSIQSVGGWRNTCV